MRKPKTFREASYFAEANGLAITEHGKGKYHCYMVYQTATSYDVISAMTVKAMCYKLARYVARRAAA